MTKRVWLTALFIAVAFVPTSVFVFATDKSQPYKASQAVVFQPAVRPGQKVMLRLRTWPGAKCRLEVADRRMLQKHNTTLVADKKGLAAWTLVVNKSFKGDRIPLVVTCSQGGAQKQKLVVLKVDQSRRAVAGAKGRAAM